MTIQDVSTNSDWDTFEVKPQPAPSDIQAKQMETDFVWKCPTTGTIINGSSGDYLVKVCESSCIKMTASQFEAAYQLKS